MGIFNQPLNQNRQPNQRRRDYNSGDSDYDDDGGDDGDSGDGGDGGGGGD